MNETTPAFRLTYASMFDPPASLHAQFDAALARVKARLGADHAMHIAGRDRTTGRWIDLHSPIDQRLLLGRFARGSAADVHEILALAW